MLMTECCVHRDMSIPKKSLILKALRKGPIDPSNPNYLVDVRLMAAGLLSVMMTAPQNSPYHRGGGDDNGDASSTARSVLGKHVLVTLGEQGLLWVSSSGKAMGWNGKAVAQGVAGQDIVELDDNTFAR